MLYYPTTTFDAEKGGGMMAPAPTAAPAAAFGATATSGTAPVTATPAAQPAPSPAPAPTGASFGPTTPAVAPATAAAPPPAGMMAPTPAPTAAPVAAPAPAATAPVTANTSPAWLQPLKGMDWSGANAKYATGRLWDTMQANGGTLGDIANFYKDEATGKPFFTEEQVKQHFAKYGYGQPGQPTPAAPGQPVTSNMDFQTETIEGRLGAVLATDANGNYINPVVRQAVDRQMQQFNARGLRNSSMAIQAGQEAAISKAIDIVGPDAQRYYDNRRGNLNTVNDFSMKDKSNAHEAGMKDKDIAQANIVRGEDQTTAMRNNYVNANDRVMERYNTQVNNINTSQMTPADKSVAIAQASAVRDADMTYNNNLFSKMPGWKQEWLVAATPAVNAQTNIETITNIDVLANIANDPAQPPELRARAKTRMDALTSGGGMMTPPAPTPAPPAGLQSPDRGTV